MGSYRIGNGTTLTATFKNSAGGVYDPAAVFFVIEAPPDANGNSAKTVIQYGQAPPLNWPAVTRVSLGVYQLALSYAQLNQVGNWHWAADDGNNVVAADADFQITGSSATHS